MATGDAGPDRLAVDPTVGVHAGLWSGGVPFGLPDDQREDEAHSLVYTGARLEAPVTILGRARTELHIAADIAVAGVAVSLSDVAPDGASHLVAKGMLNGTRRVSLTDPQPLELDAVVPLTIELDATAWRFEAGHRVRLAVAGADWPNVWPTPGTATLDVYRGPATPSRLYLPVVPDDGPLAAPAFMPSPVVARDGSAMEPPATWTVTRDAMTGRVAATIRVETSHATPEGTRIERDAGSTCEVDPADPAHAVARGWHRCSSVQDGHRTEGQAEVVIASTETDFHVTIDLAVTVDDDPPVTRRWDEHIPRVLL
jgi:hypothetical protein